MNRTNYTYLQQFHVLQMIEGFLALVDDPDRGLSVAKGVVENMQATIRARESVNARAHEGYPEERVAS